ncbi:MAG: heavy metal translocating P-type ATPase [Planctomycetaceae bacterium]
MDCAEETALLRREVGALPGVREVTFDIVRGRMAVACDAGVERAALLAAVKRAGLRASPWEERSSGGGAGARTIATLLSAAALAAGAAAQGFGRGGVPFYAVAVAAGMVEVVPRAVAAARRLRPDMHLLMVIAVAGAMGIGEWLEAASVAFLFSLSLSLEAWSVGRARRAVSSLLELAPAEATLLEGGGERRVPADAVAVGSRIVVRPHERIPLDGAILAGRSDVDEAALTGESMRVARETGDPVYAGTINGDGALEIETSKPPGETTVAHIARLVEAAGLKRSRVEAWVDRFALFYTPAVLGLAVLLLLLPPLAFAAGWETWIYRALVLLVIACPCALVISTPVGIVAGLASAARHGVLVKSGLFLEIPSRLRAFALDKTGTLTLGRPRVVRIVPLDGHTEEELLARAAAVEARAQHPIGRAIVEAARERGLSPVAAQDVAVLAGKGAEGLIEGRRYRVGSRRWLKEQETDVAEARGLLEELSGPGRSAVFVSSDRHVCGVLSLADAIRPGAREALDALRALGIERTVMLTGDNRPTAEAIARETGVDEVLAELLPEAKLAALEELKARFGAVAMVGDGVNDAPALARADLGIAMAAAGSDAAIETADVALMGDDLSRIPWLVGHSRRTLRIIRQNVAASLATKALFVLLTFVGTASLWSAIAADMGVSLAVVFNSLRLLREPRTRG